MFIIPSLQGDVYKGEKGRGVKFLYLLGVYTGSTTSGPCTVGNSMGSVCRSEERPGLCLFCLSIFLKSVSVDFCVFAIEVMVLNYWGEES